MPIRFMWLFASVRKDIIEPSPKVCLNTAERVQCGATRPSRRRSAKSIGANKQSINHCSKKAVTLGCTVSTFVLASWTAASKGTFAICILTPQERTDKLALRKHIKVRLCKNSRSGYNVDVWFFFSLKRCN